MQTKRWLIGFATALSVGSLLPLASAQETPAPAPAPEPVAPVVVSPFTRTQALEPFRVRLGLSLALGQPGVGVTASAAVNDIVRLDPNFSIGVRGRLGVAFADGAVISVGAAPVLTYRFAGAPGGVYFGPALEFAFAPGTPAVGFGVLGGVEYDIAPNVMLYGETLLDFNPFILNLAAGASFVVVDRLSAFGQLNLSTVGGSAFFGFGLGFAYRI